MDISKFLAKVIGLYLLIVALGMLIQTQHFLNSVNLLIHDAPAMFVAGFMTLILGLLLVVSHNIWERSWKVLVTVIAWVTLVKGASILFCPQYMDIATTGFMRSTEAMYISGCIDLALGVLLSYLGFRR